MNITEPLRLAVGSHKKGSGKGCAMNVVSWMNGDTEITDYPDCSDQFLALVVQQTNDAMCSRRDGDLLCAECSIEAIRLGTRTIGTASIPEDERQVVWVRIACVLAREVAHKNTDPLVMAAINAAEAWCDHPTSAAAVDASDAAYAVDAADAAVDAVVYAVDAVVYAVDAAAARASYAARAAYAVDAADAAHAASAAASAAAAVAAFAAADADRIIDMFNDMTGRTEQPVSPDSVRVAYRQMVDADEVNA